MKDGEFDEDTVRKHYRNKYRDHLVKSGKIELDEVDKKALNEFVDNSEQITVLVKGRLNEVFNPLVTIPSTQESNITPEVKPENQEQVI